MSIRSVEREFFAQHSVYNSISTKTVIFGKTALNRRFIFHGLEMAEKLTRKLKSFDALRRINPIFSKKKKKLKYSSVLSDFFFAF
jgi:hypothetical protein